MDKRRDIVIKKNVRGRKNERNSKRNNEKSYTSQQEKIENGTRGKQETIDIEKKGKEANKNISYQKEGIRK